MAEYHQEVVRSGRRKKRGGCGVSLLNVLTAMILVSALLLVGVFLLLYLAPGLIPAEITALFSRPESQEPTPTLVLLAVVPTITPSQTVSLLLEPTWTRPPADATNPPPPTNTRLPPVTPSVTNTLPPNTPTRTATPTPTNTATPGPSGTPTYTRSPFPFTKSDVSPQYLQNFANNAGCNWLGLAGEVLNLNLNPVTPGAYRVHIWDSGIDTRVTVGTAPAYGPSGWEQFVFNAPRVQDHNIQLETVNGTAVSQVYRVQTRASCNQNLLLFTFVQNH